MNWILLLMFGSLIGGILGSIIIYSYRLGITPTPTSKKVQNLLLEVIPELIEGSVAELGSGWGILCCALARHFPQTRVKAFEISPLPYFVSKMIANVLGLSNLTIQRKDFFQIHLSSFSLIVCYLYPGAMQQLKVKFEQELSPTCYVLSHTFAIPNWKPICMIRADDIYRTPIYLYQVKTAFLR